MLLLAADTSGKHGSIALAGLPQQSTSRQNSEQIEVIETVPLAGGTFSAQLVPQIAALLEGMLFVGHDSGISHVAAAAGARCILLFGWTDSAIWAPANDNVTVFHAPEGKMRLLEVEAVIAALTS